MRIGGLPWLAQVDMPKPCMEYDASLALAPGDEDVLFQRAQAQKRAGLHRAECHGGSGGPLAMTGHDPQAAAMSISDARAPRLGAETPSMALREALDACRGATALVRSDLAQISLRLDPVAMARDRLLTPEDPGRSPEP